MDAILKQPQDLTASGSSSMRFGQSSLACSSSGFTTPSFPAIAVLGNYAAFFNRSFDSVVPSRLKSPTTCFHALPFLISVT